MENLSHTGNEVCGTQDTSMIKNKMKTLGSEILLSAKMRNDEHAVLLGLVDAGSSKSFKKRESTQTTKDVVTTENKRAKWKTKDGVPETKESASVSSMKLLQLAKRREFDISKLRLYDDLDETHGIIVGRGAFQKIRLGMLIST